MNPGTSEWYMKTVAPHLPGILEKSRWFSGKGKSIVRTDLLDYGADPSWEGLILALVQVTYDDGNTETYFLPQNAGKDYSQPCTDASSSLQFISLVQDAMLQGGRIELEKGHMKGTCNENSEKIPLSTESLKPINTEQSNSSVVIGDKFIYKSFRKLSEGENPDYSACSYLKCECSFQWVPEPVAKLSIESGGKVYHAGTLTRFIPNTCDGFSMAKMMVESILGHHASGEHNVASRLEKSLLEHMEILGNATAGMHNCFSRYTKNHEFAPEPITWHDTKKWSSDFLWILDSAMKAIEAYGKHLTGGNSDFAEQLLRKRDSIHSFAEPLERLVSLNIYKTRIHGDYHLGQTLLSEGNFYVIDFEGEPMRPIDYRKSKFMPMKDLGGMVRSIDYAVEIAASSLENKSGPGTHAQSLKNNLVQKLLDSYFRSYAPESPYLPQDLPMRNSVLRFFVAEKALYEVLYEIRNRPSFSWVPMSALNALLHG